jgi:hypothetical protein
MSDPRLKFVISADNRANEALGDIESKLKQVSERAAAALSVFGMQKWVQATAEAVEQMGRMSQATGIVIQRLADLDFSARANDVEDLETALRILNQRIAEAGNSTTEGAEAFRRLGINVRNTTTGQLLSTEQILLKIAEAFRSNAV